MQKKSKLPKPDYLVGFNKAYLQKMQKKLKIYLTISLYIFLVGFLISLNPSNFAIGILLEVYGGMMICGLVAVYLGNREILREGRSIDYVRKRLEQKSKGVSKTRKTKKR